MKNTFVIIAGVLQFIAIILFIGIVKGIGALIAGNTDIPTFILMVILAFIFQGLSYVLRKKHPEESAKANKVLSEPNKNYGIFALFFFFFVIGFFSTFILEQSSARIILQGLLILIGIACSFWILRRK